MSCCSFIEKGKKNQLISCRLYHIFSDSFQAGSWEPGGAGVLQHRQKKKLGGAPPGILYDPPKKNCGEKAVILM